jgi:hypothetical protein
VCYSPAVPRAVHPSVVLLLVACWSSLASASDIVVFDRGGGVERTTRARAAVAAAGDTVLSATESDELDTAYAAGCVDAECYSRAGAAGSVVSIILVEPTTLTLIDVASATARQRPAATAAIDVVLARLRDADHFGTLDGSALPAGSSIVVDGVVYDGADLPVGATPVVVRGPNGETTVVVTVVANTATPVVLPTTPPLDTGTILVVSGAAVAVVGVVVVIVGEVWAQQALNQLQQGQEADLVQAEAIEIAGFVSAGVGVIAAGVGLVLRAGSTTVNVDDNAALEPQPSRTP